MAAPIGAAFLLEKYLNNIFAFIGTTGVGKTYYSSQIAKKYGLLTVKSVTTRPVRALQPDEYTHVTKVEFEKMIANGEILEYTTFNDNYYGTRIEHVQDLLKNNHVVYTMTADQVANLKKHFPNTKVIQLKLQEPVIENTLKRLAERNLTPAETEKRLKTLGRDLKDIGEVKSHIDYVIETIEGDSEATQKKLERIIEKHLRRLKYIGNKSSMIQGPKDLMKLERITDVYSQH
jgi:guanylate kinase